MRQRADIQIVFSFQSGQLMHESMRVSDLIGCVEQSKHFPFSSFRFKKLGANERDDVERFLSIAVRIDDEANDVEMLRVLLLEKVPNLKKLGIDFSIDLFFEEGIKAPVHLNFGSNKFELPKLNALRVHCVCERFSGIVTDILQAAPNLKLFEKRSMDYRLSECVTATELTVLTSLDKLHCLANLCLMFKEEMVTFLEKSPQIMDVQFKSIELPCDWLEQDNHQLCARTIKLINTIFFSSRNSLQTLEIPPLGWLSGLVIPKFENLQKLVLSHGEYDEDVLVYCMFPPLFDMTESFPKLRDLTVNFFGEDDYMSTYEPVNVLPNVEVLRIVFDDRYDEKLMRMTPNVKTLLVSNESDTEPSLNFHAISIYLPKLEYLRWEIRGNSQHDLQSTCEVDSHLTGFSRTFCKVKSVEFRDSDSLSSGEAASYERHRQYTSLVDLKALQRFDMHFNLDHDSYRTDCDDCEESYCECTADDDDKSCDNAGLDRYSDWYRSSLTKVSQFLAFDLMPDLETNIEFTFMG